RRHSTLSHCLSLVSMLYTFSLFFFNATATPEIYTLSLHDALPICAMLTLQSRMNARVNPKWVEAAYPYLRAVVVEGAEAMEHRGDRKSTRLNSSHVKISYAVFCLKKKNNKTKPKRRRTKSARQGTH